MCCIKRNKIGSLAYSSRGFTRLRSGPSTVFILFINDLSIDIENKISIFADDTCLYTTSDNLIDELPRISPDLKRIADWASRWLVNCNASKTVSLTVTRRTQPSDLNISFSGTDVGSSATNKHLGVTFNSKGTWKDHIEQIITKTNQKLSMLQGLKTFFNSKSLEIMYTGFIRPLVEYGDMIWDNINLNQASRLETIQKECLRAITGLTRSVSTELLYLESGFMQCPRK